MPTFTVVPELCRKDGICASVCPVHVIRGPKGKLPVMKSGKNDNCIACGHCMAFCPHGAARVDVLPLDDMRPVERKLLPDAETVERLCRARRSIRHFKKEPVPKETLERILDATRHAPSAKNRRPVRWVVAYEREKLQAIGDCARDWLSELLADENTKQVLPEAKGLMRAWRKGLDPLFRGAPHVVLAVTPKEWHWGHVDAAIALTYLEIAALPHKVGACWAGYVTAAAQSYPPLQRLLGVGEDEIVSGGQMLGFTALHPTACAPRAPLPVTWL